MSRPKYLFLLSAMLVLVTAVRGEDAFPKIRIEDGKFYAGNEELLLVTVGYNPVRPGQDHQDPVAHREFGYDLVDMDMKRIKAAGFNAIRTWHLPDEKIAALAQKHGLWMVGGIWTSQKIDVSNEGEVEKAVNTVRALARSYSKFPNTAALLVLNEPEMGMLLPQPRDKVKAYFDRLAATAREHCPGVPVGFSNWPNAAFVGSDSWDFAGYNIYSWASSTFQKSVGYRGYIEGMIKHKAVGKPFLLTEFGYWTPTPKLHPKDRYAMTYVSSEQEQSRKLLEDMDLIYQLPVAGATLMTWSDTWCMAGTDFGSPGIEKPPGYVDKNIHDPDTTEWAGLIAFDEDVRGKPRLAHDAVAQANRAIVTEPDSQAIYRNQIPVSVWLDDRVDKVELVLDGKNLGRFDRSSPHWIQESIPVKGRNLARHQLIVRACDSGDRVLNETSRTVWTGHDKLPTLSVRHEKDETNRVFFVFELKDGSGKPIADASIDWGILDGVGWQEKSGTLRTGPDGTGRLKRPLPSNFLLVGGGYDYAEDGFRRKITDLDLYRQ